MQKAKQTFQLGLTGIEPAWSQEGDLHGTLKTTAPSEDQETFKKIGPADDAEEVQKTVEEGQKNHQRGRPLPGFSISCVEGQPEVLFLGARFVDTEVGKNSGSSEAAR